MELIPNKDYHNNHVRVMLQIKVSNHVKKLHNSQQHEDKFDDCVLCLNTIRILIRNFNDV